MSKIVLAVVGVVLLLMGTLFALQGFGVIGGSAMSGTTLWSILGPVIALVGLALLVRSARRRPARRV